MDKDLEMRFIKALVKKNREIERMKIKNELYSLFLTDEQKQAADLYAEQYIKRRDL